MWKVDERDDMNMRWKPGCKQTSDVNRCQKDVIDGRLVLASPRRVTGPQHDEVRAVAGEIAYRWRDKWQKTLQREKKKIEFQNGDDVPLFTSQSAPGCPGTGEQKAGDK